MSVRQYVERSMRMLWRAQSRTLAWWWVLLALVSTGNITVWLMMYRQTSTQRADMLSTSSGNDLMLFLSAAYVSGCAFRSFLPRADVQRICLFDTWLSSVVIGRSVATVAEVCFAAQWAIILGQLGGIAGLDFVVNIAWLVVPLIIVAQGCSWYGVLTTNYLANAIENSIWAATFLLVGVGLCRLLPEFDGLVHFAIMAGIFGIAAFLVFLTTIDVPMYLSRWQQWRANGGKSLHPLEGLRDVSTRWVVTHDFEQWKDEIAWMTLYFSGAVWASLTLCLVSSLDAGALR